MLTPKGQLAAVNLPVRIQGARTEAFPHMINAGALSDLPPALRDSERVCKRLPAYKTQYWLIMVDMMLK